MTNEEKEQEVDVEVYIQARNEGATEQEAFELATEGEKDE